MNDQDLMQLARKRTDTKMGFLIHLAVFVLVNGALWLVGQSAGRETHFLPFWGWTLGLCIHGCVVLLSLSGTDLRERLLQSEIERLRRRG